MKVKIKCHCGNTTYIKVKNMKEARRLKKDKYPVMDCCIPF